MTEDRKKPGFDKDAANKSILGGEPEPAAPLKPSTLKDSANKPFAPKDKPENDNQRKSRPPEPAPGHDDDGDDGTIRPELQPLFFEAMRSIFEDRPKVLQAIDCRTHLNMDTMDVTRTLLLDLSKTDIDAEKLNTMLAAAFLRPVRNLDAVRNDFDEETMKTVEELRTIGKRDAWETRNRKVAAFTMPEAKAVFLADIIVDMETTADVARVIPEVLPTVEQTAARSKELKALSLMPDMNDTLVEHMVAAYNRLSIEVKCPIALIRNNDNELQHVIKKPNDPAPKPEIDPPKKGPSPKNRKPRPPSR